MLRAVSYDIFDHTKLPTCMVNSWCTVRETL